jgi:hypothetical protein
MSIIIGGNTLSGNNFSPSGLQPKLSSVTRGLVCWLDAGDSSSYANTSYYYDCGYGCQYYTSDPGCTNCNSQWKDLSGYGHDGTLYGSISMTNGDTGGGAFYFNGSNAYVNITSTALLNPSSGVISTGAWFKSTDVGSQNDRILINKENEYEISAGGGYITYAFRPNWAWVGATAFNINQWYHVMVTYDQSYQRLYVNGVEVYNAALSGAIGATYANDLRIGARNAPGSPTSPFLGYIAVAQVYNVALTAQEVLTLYNNGRQRFGV